MTTLIVRSVLPGTMGANGIRSTVGHSWIEIHNSNGTVESLGYYPEVSSPYAPGAVKTTDAGQFPSVVGFKSQPITITEAQAQAFRDFATITNQFGTYALLGNDGSNPFGTYNCASWIVSGLKTAQVSGQFPTALIVPWFAPIQFDPFTPLAPLERGFAIVSPVVNTAYTLALNWVEPRRDPLVLDLDGGGITTSGINPAAPILFDQDGDGTLTATGWIASGEAIVVRDLNGNGRIDSGRELFGDNTVLTRGPNVGQLASNGFTALADLDANAAGVADGKFDASDAAFASVKLWKDLNQNGVSEAGELFSFADLGVQHINLAATASNVNLGGGNTQTFTGSFTRVSGVVGSAGTAELAGSLLLANNNFYRQFTDDPVVTAAAAGLPQMQGSGWVRDLREAMSLGTPAALALQAKVNAFAAATSRDAQMALLDEVVTAWGNTSTRVASVADTSVSVWDYSFNAGVDSTNGGAFHLRFGAALDAKGLNWRGVLGTVNGVSREQQFGNMLVAAGLIKGFKSGTAGNIQLPYLHIWSISAAEAFAQSSPVNAGIAKALDAFNGRAVLDRFVGVKTNSSSGPVDYAVFLPPAVSALLSQAYSSLKESVYAALAVQTRLKTYLDGIGLVIDASGLRFDTTNMVALLDSRKTANERNTIIDLVELNRFASPTLMAVGFNPAEKLRAWVDALPIGGPLKAELATLDVYFANTSTGTSRADIFLGDAAANTFQAGSGNDVLDGGAGNDSLVAGDGDDILRGGDGNDNLSGEAGADTLEGGTGNDQLTGGMGNDTYWLARGYGTDTIIDNDATAGNTDVARFDVGIATDQLWFRKLANDLEVSIIGTSDRFTLTNWYLGNQYHVEQFKTSDGKTLLDSQVQNLVSAMAGFAPPAAGQTTLPANYATTLAPVLAANWV